MFVSIIAYLIISRLFYYYEYMGKARIGYKVGSTYVSRNVEDKDVYKEIVKYEAAKGIASIIVKILFLPLTIIVEIFSAFFKHK